MRAVGYVAAAVTIFVLGDVFGTEGAVDALNDGLSYIREAIDKYAS